ncbi:MAG: helix-turn-helix domain-containing protein [Candidatus Limnocylindrales bacterium]
MATDRSSNFFIPPTFAWAERVTGRDGWQPGYELLAFGMYVKRARYLARCTQTRLEELSGVDQGRISRLERGLSPTTRVEHLVPIAAALGRALPLGFCPHEHWCQWQPAPAPPPPRDWLKEWHDAEDRLNAADDEPTGPGQPDAGSAV